MQNKMFYMLQRVAGSIIVLFVSEQNGHSVFIALQLLQARASYWKEKLHNCYIVMSNRDLSLDVRLQFGIEAVPPMI